MRVSQVNVTDCRMTQLALSLFRPAAHAQARRNMVRVKSRASKPLAYRLLLWAFRNN